MAYTLASVFAFYRDVVLAHLLLAFGRLYPTLRVPHQDLSKKIAIITGANSGIGFEIASELARRGATVYLACRNTSKANDAVSEITSKVPSSVEKLKVLSLDTSSLIAVRMFAQSWAARNDTQRIDYLFHNAGTGASAAGSKYTADGFPPLYATNFLGSYLLTYLLEPHLAPDTRVILTSSTAAFVGSFSSSFSLKSIQQEVEPGFHAPSNKVLPGKATADESIYINTKAMQVAFAKLLQDHFDRQAEESGGQQKRLAHSFTPGFTQSPFFGKISARSFAEDPIWWVLMATNRMLATDTSQGAATGVWLATTMDEDVVGRGKGGAFWQRMARQVSNIDIMAWENVERLWVRWEADAGIEWR